jgi:hypothetical protein
MKDKNIQYLFNQDNSQKSVLLYAREPFQWALKFREYGDLIIKKHLGFIGKYDIMSDYPTHCDFYIDLKKYKYSDLTTTDFEIIGKVIDIDNIIKNERVFRLTMTYSDALKLILSCSKCVIEVFKAKKYDILVTHMVDSYVVDIITRIARYYEVPIVSFCGSSFGKEYLSITERGEPYIVRDVEENEITNFIQNIQNKQKGICVLSKKDIYISILRNYLVYKAKYVYHHLFRHKLLGQVDYRFLTTKAGSYPRKLSNIFNIKKYFVQQVKDLPALIKNKTVYLPLHYHPEATTEYWVHNDKYLTYYPSLFKVIKNYTERGFTVLVKEHTAMYMMRDRDLYKEIYQLPNVFLLSPYITTYEVLDYVEYTILWTGTTGVEAIMTDNKVILTETETYYSGTKLAYMGNEDASVIFNQIEKRDLVKKILQGLLPIEF